MKLITLLALLLLTLPLFVKADGTKSELFIYDEQKLELAFSELNSLEEQVNDGLILIGDTPKDKGNGYTALGLNPFVFGMLGGCIGSACGFWGGPVAAMFVYFDSDKNEEAGKQALYGCFVGTGLGLTAYVAYYIAVLSYAY